MGPQHEAWIDVLCPQCDESGYDVRLLGAAQRGARVSKVRRRDRPALRGIQREAEQPSASGRRSGTRARSEPSGDASRPIPERRCLRISARMATYHHSATIPKPRSMNSSAAQGASAGETVGGVER